ncbi:TRAP transporter small permease [Alkalibacter mobilis]|uniref:TRAP transporter small permease n=1 Tax=Alkalibacter mobilis TaxID=2787712 RepID=UPI00189EBBAB|nr:TRAP transporter small permease [Alkalibacter mobilis]MBF7097305.1 TRAP transporter small permease [Alkalibacter mobilis]
MKRFFENFEFVVASIAFVFMILFVSLNVFTRYIIGYSMSFSEEVAYLSFTYVVFFGICMLFKYQALVAIDVLVERFPEKVQKFVEVFIYAFLTVVNAILIYYSVILTVQAWGRPTASLRIPYSFVDAPAVYAFTVMFVYSVRFLIEAIRNLRSDNISVE